MEMDKKVSFVDWALVSLLQQVVYSQDVHTQSMTLSADVIHPNAVPCCMSVCLCVQCLCLWIVFCLVSSPVSDHLVVPLVCLSVLRLINRSISRSVYLAL